MGMGNYSNGFREGIMIRGTAMFDAGYGRAWYVDAKVGADGNSGKRRDRPFLTMSKALSVIDSGDMIFFRGKVREQLTAPDGVFDVTIIGASNRPRHADDHTESGGARGSSAATWVLPASPVAATPLLTIRNQGWRLVNFLMGATTSQVCVDLVTNSESGDDEYSSGHFSCYGMRFDGAGTGIRDNGPGGFVGIYDSFFRGQTTGIGQVAGAGPGTRSWWEIKGNRFSDNTNGIAAILIRSVIRGNMFLPTHTIEINLPTGSSSNIVTENVFTGDYDANVAGTGDVWFNNYALDAASGEVDDTTGQTTAVPAA
jgi:hypothetical protein